MKKTFLPNYRRILSSLALLLSISVYAQQNISFLAHLPYDSGVQCNNLTGYVDSANREYALVGTSAGLSIVLIDTSDMVVNDSIDTVLVQPVQLFLLADSAHLNALWSDVTTHNGYAYAISAGDSGLMVANLNYLPDSVSFHIIHPGGMTTAQTIFIDEHGTAYVNGTDAGQLFLSLDSNGWNPPLAGAFTSNYVQNCFVRNDTMWALCPYDGIIQAIDVYDKTDANNPSKIRAIIPITQNFPHNCWLSNDNDYLFTVGEYPGSFLTCYNVSYLQNIVETDQAQATLGSKAIIHNAYYLNNYVITSYNTYGIAIFDALRRNNMLAIGHFETTDSTDTVASAYGVYPYLPSGYIIASDVNSGLWVLQPNYVRAGYLEGTIMDSVCNIPLAGVTIQILGDSAVSYSDALGNYGIGTPDTGAFTIQFSLPGYQTLDTSDITFYNGFLQDLNITLTADSTSNLTLETTDSATGGPIPFTPVLITVTAGNAVQLVATNYVAQYNFCNFLRGTYDAYSGMWGRKTARVAFTDSMAIDTLLIPTDTGYYDDFILDYGWTVSSTASTGDWVRAAPVGKMYDSLVASPYTDVPGDYGNDCYITGNSGGPANYDDVDSGYTLLTSPYFNLHPYTDPHVTYYRWFFNAGEHLRDTMWVLLSNGFDTVAIDTIDTVANEWIHKDKRILDYMGYFGDNMQIFFKVQNYSPQNMVKAAVDWFTVYNAIDTMKPDTTKKDTSSGIIVIAKPVPSLKAYPNPFSDVVNIAIQNFTSQDGMIELTNTLGQTLYRRKVTGNEPVIQIRMDLPGGMYMVKLLDGQGTVASTKIIRTD